MKNFSWECELHISFPIFNPNKAASQGWLFFCNVILTGLLQDFFTITAENEEEHERGLFN